VPTLAIADEGFSPGSGASHSYSVLQADAEATRITILLSIICIAIDPYSVSLQTSPGRLEVRSRAKGCGGSRVFITDVLAVTAFLLFTRNITT
jgi:hypothetical protein